MLFRSPMLFFGAFLSLPHGCTRADAVVWQRRLPSARSVFLAVRVLQARGSLCSQLDSQPLQSRHLRDRRGSRSRLWWLLPHHGRRFRYVFFVHSRASSSSPTSSLPQVWWLSSARRLPSSCSSPSLSSSSIARSKRASPLLSPPLRFLTRVSQVLPGDRKSVV